MEERVKLVNTTRSMKEAAEKLAKVEIDRKMIKNALVRDA